MFAVTLSLLLCATPAEKLAEAAQAVDALEYEKALAALPAMEEVAGFEQEQVTALFAFRALALASLKRDEEATEAFRQLYAVAPAWKIPEQYGPRIRTLAGMASAEADEQGTLAVKYTNGTLQIGKDSYGYGTAFELTWRVDDGSPTTRRFPVGVTVPAPWERTQRIDVFGRFIGLQDSTLGTWGSEKAPIRIGASTPASAPVAAAARPLRPLTIGAIAAGALALGAGAAGIAFAGGSTEAQRALASATRDDAGRITSLSQRDAFAIEQRSAAAATLSGVFFVTAGVLAAGGVGLLVFDRVRATPTPGGVALSIPLDATFGFASAGATP